MTCVVSWTGRGSSAARPLRWPPPPPPRKQRQRGRGSGSGGRDGDGEADLAALGPGAAGCGVQRLLVQRQRAGPRAHSWWRRRLLRNDAPGWALSTESMQIKCGSCDKVVQ